MEPRYKDKVGSTPRSMQLAFARQDEETRGEMMLSPSCTRIQPASINADGDKQLARANIGKNTWQIKPFMGEKDPVPYHTRQAFWETMGCPALQPNASWKAAEFCTAPLARQRPGE
jgi:hypothetical protein